ncbi:YaaC family protein, partial [Staphylococcus saprophyticus]
DIWNKDGEFILTWKNGPTLKDKRAINSEDMKVFHTNLRRYYQEISAGSNSRWYFKNFEDDNVVDLNPLVIMLIVMHRLSELSRYNPGILSNYLASDQSWLLSEFISLSPFQFINGISAEITSQQLGIPRSPKLYF